MYIKTIKFVILIALLGLVYPAMAQFEDFEDDEKVSVNVNKKKNNNEFFDKFAFGGSLGLGFSSSFGYIEFLPFFGYRFNDIVTAGVAATYMYSYYEDYWTDEGFDNHIFGGGIFTDIYPFRFLVFHAEAQALNFKNISDGYYYNLNPSRTWEIPMLLGVGYHQSITDRIGINYMLLWNFNDSNTIKYNVYENPIIRISFVF